MRYGRTSLTGLTLPFGGVNHARGTLLNRPLLEHNLPALSSKICGKCRIFCIFLCHSNGMKFAPSPDRREGARAQPEGRRAAEVRNRYMNT
jgi:hypothetical protein